MTSNNWRTALNVPKIAIPKAADVTTEELVAEKKFGMVPSTAKNAVICANLAYWSYGANDVDAVTEVKTGLPFAFAACSLTPQTYAALLAIDGVTITQPYLTTKYNRLAKPGNPTAVPAIPASPEVPFVGPADATVRNHMKVVMQLIGLSSLVKSDTGTSATAARTSLVNRYKAICTMSATSPIDVVQTKILALPDGVLDQASAYLWIHPSLARLIILTVIECAKQSNDNKTFDSLCKQVAMMYDGAMMTVPKTIAQFATMDMTSIKLHSAFVTEWRKLKAAMDFLEKEYGEDYPYCRILMLPHNNRLNSSEFPFLTSVTTFWLNSIQAVGGTQRASYQSKLGGQFDSIIRELAKKPIDPALIGASSFHLTESEARDFGLDYDALQRGVVPQQPSNARILAALNALGINP